MSDIYINLIDKLQERIGHLKDANEKHVAYIRELENDYSRVGLERVRYRKALESIVAIGVDEKREDDDPEDLYLECDTIARAALQSSEGDPR